MSGQNKNVNQQEIKIKRKIFRTNIIWHLSKMLNKKTNIKLKCLRLQKVTSHL